MKKVNNIEIEVLRGNITKITTDGLIVPQHCNHVLNNKLNKRLRYCGYEKALNDFEAFARFNLTETGCVMRTIGGANAKNLFHSIVLPSEEAFLSIQECLLQVLYLAEENGVPTLALPEFRDDDGIPLLTPAEMVQTALGVLKGYSNEKKIVKEFSIVLDCSVKEFEQAEDLLENFDIQENLSAAV